MGGIPPFTAIDPLLASLAEGEAIAIGIKCFYAHAKRIVLRLCAHEVDTLRSKHLVILPKIVRLDKEHAGHGMGRRPGHGSAGK